MLDFNAEGRVIDIEVVDVRERVLASAHRKGTGKNSAAME
jgi:hypothetical protein